MLLKDNEGYRFSEKKHNLINQLIGKKKTLENWKLIKSYDLFYLDLGQGEKVYYFARKNIDLCLRFVSEWGDDCIELLELTDVYHYPEIYTKTLKQVNNEMIHNRALVEGIFKEVDSLSKGGDGVSEDDFVNLLIESYEFLRDSKKLKQ